MEIVLLSVTVVSLLLALVMSAAAWRVSRHERARSAARVAALAAAAAEAPESRGDEPAVTPVPRHEPDRPARPWTAAPAAALRVPATRASAVRADAPWAPAASPATSDRAPLGDAFLGSAVAAAPGSHRQRGLAIAAGVLFVVVFVTGYFTVFDGPSPGGTPVAASAVAAPLELISLTHQRQGSDLSVSGVVRNPVQGAGAERVSAVVALLDGDGRIAATAEAGIDIVHLAAGEESPFVVTARAPSTVTRYRVSFRNAQGLVAHVDRRGQEPIARTKEAP